MIATCDVMLNNHSREFMQYIWPGTDQYKIDFSKNVPLGDNFRIAQVP